MLQKNAISEISPDNPVFELIPGMQGVWRGRPVIDLKQLNHNIDAPLFRMQTISSVLNTIANRDYAFKKDLQDAYFHVLIYPESRKYLRFAFKNKFFSVPSTSLQ